MSNQKQLLMQGGLEFKTIQEDFGRGMAEWHKLENDNAERLFFLAANGMPVSTYPFFLKRLAAAYDVYGLENRAVWPGRGEPSLQDLWANFLADYECFLDRHNVVDRSLIHVGHSLGGSLGALLAIKRPELFKRLVIIEPGMVPTRRQNIGYRMMPFARRGKIPHMARTGARQSVFESRQAFMDSMRSKNSYRHFSDEAMRDYAEGGLVRDGEQYRLKFSGLWEKHIFCDVHYMLGRFIQLKVPTLLLLADNSFILPEAKYRTYAKRCQKKNPNITIKLMSGVSHLAVQDNPDLVTSEVLDWLSST